MSQIEITPAFLSDLRQKAEKVEPNDYILTDGLVIKSESFKDLTIADCAFSDDAEFIAAASPAVVLALVAEVERLNFALDEILCQFDYQNNPKWRAEMKEAMIEMAKKKQDMRQSSGNETDFVSKGEVKE
jgi:hypothetical protein